MDLCLMSPIRRGKVGKKLKFSWAIKGKWIKQCEIGPLVLMETCDQQGQKSELGKGRR